MKVTNLFCCMLILSGGCSKIDGFKKDTDSMNKTTQELRSKTESITDLAHSLFPQIRSGDTVGIRDRQWNILTNRDKKLGQKMVASGVFFQSFEYQFWTANNINDNKIVLDYMYRDAADELQGRMYDLYREINPRKMSPTNEGKSQNEEQAFYAMAFTMDRGHHFQKELSRKNPDLKLVTFYKIIKDCLVKEKRQAHLKEHEIILLAGINKEIITELLRARVDMLASLALKDLIELRDMGISHYAKAAIFKITMGRLGSIDIPETYAVSNDATKINVENYLQSAVETKNFLKSVDIKFKLEKTVRSAYKEIEFAEVSTMTGEQLAQKAIIQNLVQELLN